MTITSGVSEHFTCFCRTFEGECAQLEAAAGVRVSGDEQEIVTNGKGANVGRKLRTKKIL